MQFVYPAFLWALTAVSIPVIIHLFHFRRYKKIVFSDIRFLKQLQEQNKSKQKIKDWLILACRVLAITLLVLAFAQPFIPIGESSRQGGQKNISIFVDNSNSMNAEGSEGVLLEMAKNKARAIVNAYGNSDKFQVLTNNLSGSEQRYLNKPDALNRIDALEPSKFSEKATAITAKQLAGFSMQNSSVKQAYLISDFQAGQFNLDQLEKDTITHYSFIPVINTSAQNISIDSVYLTTPFVKTNEPVKLNIRLSNHGTEALEGIAVTLRLNNVQKALVNVNMAGNESIVAEMSTVIANSDWQKGEVSITDYPVTYDDRLYFSLKASSQHNILLLSNMPNQFINAVYGDDANYNLTQNSFGNISYQTFNKYNLIILNEPVEISSGLQTELDKYLEQGGQVLIIPPATNAALLNPFMLNYLLPSYTAISSQTLKVSDVSENSVLFKSVFKKLSGNTDLPAVKQHYGLQRQSATKGRAVIALNNGDAFLWQANTKKGIVYVLGAPLNTAFTSLPQHSLFVAMMLNMAMGNAKGQNLYYTINESDYIQLSNTTNTQGKLISIKNNDQELITEITQRNGQKLLHAEAINYAGWFDIKEKSNNQLLSVAAFNLNRNESGMHFLSEEDITSQTKGLKHAEVNTNNAQVLGAQISEALSGKSLWRWFVLMALIFLVIELLLLKIK
ncbi:MAG: BatA domain-containing protein [Bacteroidota bacterium]